MWVRVGGIGLVRTVMVYCGVRYTLDGDSQCRERSRSVPRILRMIKQNPTGNTIRRTRRMHACPGTVGLRAHQTKECGLRGPIRKTSLYYVMKSSMHKEHLTRPA